MFNCSILTNRPTELVLRNGDLVSVFLALAGIGLLQDQRPGLTILISVLTATRLPNFLNCVVSVASYLHDLG